MIVDPYAPLYAHACTYPHLHPTQWQPLVPIMTFIGGQLPFYISCWAHSFIGFILLGCETDGIDYFTVDEFNFLVVPVIYAVKLLPVNVWQVSVPFLVQVWPTATVGSSLVVTFLACTGYGSLKLLYNLLNSKNISSFLPGALFGIIVVLLSIDVLSSMPIFAVLAAETIARRLGFHTETKMWLWWPLVPLIIFGVFFPLRLVHHTYTWWWKLSPTLLVHAAAYTCLVVVLLNYRYQINHLKTKK
eukprot:Platyproteum_vivax@DN7140_c0_g1_i2.p1